MEAEGRVQGPEVREWALGAQGPRLPLSRACREMEEVFLRFLVRELRTGVGSGAGRYDSLIEEGMAAALAESGQLGIAEMLREKLEVRD